jgi:exonuclease SbcC
MRTRVAELQEEANALAPLVAKAGPLAGAEGRLAELVPQLDDARRVVAKGENELERLPALPDVQVAVDVSSARRAVTDAERIAREAASALAVAEQRLEAATAGAERLVGLERDRDAAGAELADWTRLALDLGRDGLQAAEIDAAGPELTELVNDLLHTCHGPRFTVRVETQRASADGKRVLEGCDVVVLDTVGGREAQGETFSGGERVIIGEALSLALSMLACRRAGLEGVTLVRDESGAALDPENARTYVAMLRRAAELVRADKVLFVSHSPEVVEMADSRIEVG